LTALPGRDASDHIGAVFHALLRMKSTGAAGNALHTQASILIDEDGHKRFLNQESQEKS
jgi:hypothetical protein